MMKSSPSLCLLHLSECYQQTLKVNLQIWVYVRDNSKTLEQITAKPALVLEQELSAVELVKATEAEFQEKSQAILEKLKSETGGKL
jgi:hypothetical protein